MLMPSIFGEDMFDDFMRSFPFFDNSAESNVEKKLYGHNAKNVMKTDIKELEGGYELEIDLPQRALLSRSREQILTQYEEKN